MPGHPTDFDNSTVRAGCACSMCGAGLFGSLLSFLYFSLSESSIQTEMLSQESLNIKHQPSSPSISCSTKAWNVPGRLTLSFNRRLVAEVGMLLNDG